MELQTALAAAREAEAAEQREPKPQRLAEPPDEKTQQKHMLTHLPFAEWCQHCVAHRARQDRHVRDGSVKAGGIPTVSFDFAYTKAVGPNGEVQNTDTVIALIMVDSSTNYTVCAPIKGKNDFAVMVREILQFTQVLGHAECNYLCDNEPSIRQVQERAGRARQSLGLATRSKTPAAYSHGNSLCENTVGRVRALLAGTLMHHVQEKLSTQLSTNHGLWSWALRHSSWLLNRFAVAHGCTPYELVYQKVYQGRMTEFGEPAFAYTHTALKGNLKWQRVLVLGKTEAQDTYIVFTGSTVMLTRSIRRIATDWKCHLGFYLHFNAPTWQSKSGFGGRVIPTRKTVVGKSASFAPPSVPILPHPLHDADAEAVKKKMVEEKTEERETKAMGEQDVDAESQVTGQIGDSSANPDVIAVDDQGNGLPSPLVISSQPVRAGEVVVDSVFDDDVTDASFLPAMVSQVDMPHDVGQAAPITPPMSSMQLPPTPRQPHSTRLHDDDSNVEHECQEGQNRTTKEAALESDHAVQRVHDSNGDSWLRSVCNNG